MRRVLIASFLAGLARASQPGQSVHWDHLTGSGFVEAAVPSARLGAESFYVSLSFRTTQKVFFNDFLETRRAF